MHTERNWYFIKKKMGMERCRYEEFCKKRRKIWGCDLVVEGGTGREERVGIERKI